MDQELPTITGIVIVTGEWFEANWLMALIALVGSIIAMSLAMKYNQRVGYMFDSFMLKLPFFGRIIRSSELGRFAYISSILFKSGVPFVQTINLSRPNPA